MTSGRRPPTGSDRGVHVRGEAVERHRPAEQRVAGTIGADDAGASSTDTTTLLHELQVQRAELEKQNEELERSRAEAEAALARYTDIYEFAPVGYFGLGRDGTIRQVNLFGAHLLGVDRADLVGRRLGVFVAAGSRLAFHCFVDRVFLDQTQQRCDVELEVPLDGGEDRAGGPRWVRFEATASAGSEECRAVALDITERKLAEGARGRAVAVIERTRDFVGTATLDGRVTHVNRAGLALVGLDSVEEACGTSILDYVPDDRRTGLQLDVIPAVMRDGHAAGRSQLLSFATGAPIDVDYDVFLLREATHGEPTGVAVVFRDIREQLANEAELRRSREQLRDFSAYLQRAIEAERTHIAREVHDELGQLLTAVKMDLGWLRDRRPADMAVQRQKLGATIDLVDEAIGSVKAIATQLRPSLLDHLGLGPALEWLAEDFERRTETSCELDMGDVPPVGREATTALFRICQEALTNVTRHARATRVVIRLSGRDGTVALEVTDDGVGIPPERVDAPASFGLIGMRERATALDGSFHIAGSPGSGTTVAVTVSTARVPAPLEGPMVAR